jgi:tetratricopeptide (TPR) repeat protein
MPVATEERKKSNSEPTLLSQIWYLVSRVIGNRSSWTTILPTLLVASELIDHHKWRAGFAMISICLALLLCMMYMIALNMTRQTTICRALEGRYEDALRLNKRLLRIPGYGGSLEGWILLEAGRYSEAQAVTRPLAFDADGQPRLASWQLYYYAMALSHQGKAAEAQELLEWAAWQRPNHLGHNYLGLAGCLLLQNKDPERARELLDRLVANWQEPVSPNRKHAKQALRKAEFAWALARCARRDEAIAQMREASAESAEYMDRDRAHLQYYAGETWWALGEKEKALDAFKEASALHPHGQLELEARERLSKLRESIWGL